MHFRLSWRWWCVSTGVVGQLIIGWSGDLPPTPRLKTGPGQAHENGRTSRKMPKLRSGTIELEYRGCVGWSPSRDCITLGIAGEGQLRLTWFFNYMNCIAYSVRFMSNLTLFQINFYFSPCFNNPKNRNLVLKFILK